VVEILGRLRSNGDQDDCCGRGRREQIVVVVGLTGVRYEYCNDNDKMSNP
jgi:hypothetical protein